MMEIKNAKIKSTMLGFEDHGIFTCFLHLDYGVGCQGFGGYSIDGKYASLWIKNILKVVGVEKWEDLVGKFVRVEAEHIKVHKIGNVLEDRWFNPEEHFK